MLLKILGVFDLIASLLLLVLAFGISIPSPILTFFILILVAKGVFIFTKSIASMIDVFAVIILLLSFSFAVPKFLFLITAFLLLQKGFLSLA